MYIKTSRAIALLIYSSRQNSAVLSNCFKSLTELLIIHIQLHIFFSTIFMALVSCSREYILSPVSVLTISSANFSGCVLCFLSSRLILVYLVLQLIISFLKFFCIFCIEMQKYKYENDSYSHYTGLGYSFDTVKHPITGNIEFNLLINPY